MGAGWPMYGSNISYRRGIHTAARTTTSSHKPTRFCYRLIASDMRTLNTGGGVLKDGIKGRVLFRAG
jgi:hypothetical protein